MGERGGAMTVVWLQKQPGTVERDGSRWASRPFWRPHVYQPATRVAEPLLRRRAGWVLNSEAEILLQIRCRWHAARLTMQSVIAQPDSCGSSRTGCPVHQVRLEVWSDEVGRESLIGWIGAVRPSRRPRARPSQDEELSSCHPKAYPHPEKRRRARLEGRKTVRQFLAQLRSGTHGRRHRA